jgi:hypothetical protein
MSQTITCPSGLAGRIRGMNVREESILAETVLPDAGNRVVFWLISGADERQMVGAGARKRRFIKGLFLERTLGRTCRGALLARATLASSPTRRTRTAPSSRSACEWS